MNQSLLILMSWVACSGGGYRLGKYPRFSKRRSTKLPSWPAKWGCFATNIGWDFFSWKPEKNGKLITYSKFIFYLVLRMFLSQPISNAWQLLICEILQQGFSRKVSGCKNRTRRHRQNQFFLLQTIILQLGFC